MRNFVFAAALFLGTYGTANAQIPNILGLENVKAGTKAIGFSVFKGVEPQPFDVVLEEPMDAFGFYLILLRISGGPMETPLEKMGAIAGMSGSPIYVGCINNNLSPKEQRDFCRKNGVLVGALSYSICILCEGGPNAAATPAEYMLGKNLEGYVAAGGLSRRHVRKITDTSGWKNLMLTPSFDSKMNEQLPRCKEFSNSDIEPGSMISIYLAKGTMNVAVSGTVTWREGNTIYAFGHPFTGAGLVNYPFSQVSVANTVQTSVEPRKVPGCELPVNGALLIDGAYEVAGNIGQKVEMIPFDVHMFVGNQQTTFHDDIVHDNPMMGVILKLLPEIWARDIIGGLDGTSIFYQARIVVNNHPEIYGKSVIPVATASPVPFAELFKRVYGAITAIQESGFQYDLESIDIDIKLADMKVWKKKTAFLSKTKASPGETVNLHIVLENQENAELKHISIPIRIPADFAERISANPVAPPFVSVTVKGGADFVDPRDKSVRTAVTLGSVIAGINKKINPETNVLYVQQSFPQSKQKKEQEESAAQSIGLSAGKWSALEAGELALFPSGDQLEFIIERTATLDNYIDFNSSFAVSVDINKENSPSQNQSSNKGKKRFSYLKPWRWF